ncbi:MAG: hypothetical protein O7A04_10340, partial [Acidobacteria bacterium]|nr:hypothetical protein [Acidobacteriota bacterium]
LGSIYERRNQPSEAELHYAAAVRLNPDSGEALIRHAICAARLGNLAAARRGLDRALALDGPGWVHRIAFQEKARLEGDLATKESVAREGKKRFPDSSRQAILLAFVLEQRRQPGLALEIVNGLSSLAEEESERYRYARWPATALAGARIRLRQRAQAHNEILASASDESQIDRLGE